MVGETIQFEKAAEGASDGKREQSTIIFPYLDLDAAIEHLLSPRLGALRERRF